MLAWRRARGWSVTDNWFNDARTTMGDGLIEEGAAGGGSGYGGGGRSFARAVPARRGGDRAGGLEAQYFQISAAGYPDAWRDRVVEAVGEELPFPDACFDLVTTYQTLEHVRDVNQCLSEMLRVLKPGGVLYARAPDYNSFFEPHYRLPFLPRMNRRVAAAYLKALGRPVEGLNTLNWVTGRGVRRAIQKLDPRALIEDNRRWYARD